MRINAQSIWIPFLTVAVSIFAGCSRSDFSAEVRDTRGVAENAPVIFRDMRVGYVGKVVPTETGFRLEVTLEKPYRDMMRADLRACPLPEGYKSLWGDVVREPTLVLIGGVNTSLPLLERGAVVSEVTLREVETKTWLTKLLGNLTHVRIWISLCVGILIIFRFMIKIAKGVVKLAVAAVLIAALLYGAYRIKADWLPEWIPMVLSEEVKNWLHDNKDLFIIPSGTMPGDELEGE